MFSHECYVGLCVFYLSCIGFSDDKCRVILIYMRVIFVIFFFKQKTAYEMRISDWSSDVCSSDLHLHRLVEHDRPEVEQEEGVRIVARVGVRGATDVAVEIGRASCRERVCQYV